MNFPTGKFAPAAVGASVGLGAAVGVAAGLHAANTKVSARTNDKYFVFMELLFF
jgi:hypothetical protein